uniref:RING-type domain-containing protein n=1 Tax=Leersia perrieri TaxID=77586 RepID=A0A0D9XYX5_9ORYZ
MEVVVARRGIVVLRPRPGGDDNAAAARSGRCSRLLLLWAFAVGLAVGLFMFGSHLLASAVAALLLAAMCFYTCLSLHAAQPPPPPDHLLRVSAMMTTRRRQEEEVDHEVAIPAFEYGKGLGEEEEECAVCIAAVKEGETARRLPACGHAFHAPCIDGWLRAHATCPVCRADVKVAVVVVGGGGGGAAV